MINEKPDQSNDLLLDQPSKQELREKLFEQPQPKAKLKRLNVPLVPWSSVIVPAKATDLQRLTYVPGVVGDMTEWMIRGATRPNRMMALGVATTIVGTLIGRHVMGPTESATHLYLVMLAPTGYGKDWPLKAGQMLLRSVGKQALIGPDSWSSDVGFQLRLQEQPLLCCFVDELGDIRGGELVGGKFPVQDVKYVGEIVAILVLGILFQEQILEGDGYRACPVLGLKRAWFGVVGHQLGGVLDR